MTTVTENMTTETVDCAIEDAWEADTKIHLKDPIGKVSHYVTKTPKRGEEEEDELKNSELELLSNLSSSTEIEQETKEHNLRRSKRLTKLFRLNNPVPSDYRKYRQKAQPRSEPNQRVKTSKQQACPEEFQNDWTIPYDATGETMATQSLGLPTAHKQNSDPQLDNNYPII